MADLHSSSTTTATIEARAQKKPPMGFSSNSVPFFTKPKSLPFLNPSSQPAGTRTSRQSPFSLIPFPNLPRRLPRSIETALLINGVPFLWGSYAAAAKIITNLEPTIPLTLLNLLTTMASMVALALVRQNPANKGAAAKKPVPFRVSLELGGYLFFGCWLHLRSVAFTSASRSSFFIQFTTFFVPMIEFVMGNAVSPAVIPACLLTLAGAACLVLPEDPSAVTGFSSLFSSLNYGDILGITSAISYSLHIVRVQVLAPRAGANMSLVEGQVAGQLLFSFVWEVALNLFGDHSGPAYLMSIPTLSTQNITTTLLCILWIGMLTNALSTWVQITGQQRVGASRAAIFYATQPVWAVILSVLIGLDSLSTFEIIGGILIVSGSVLLAIADSGSGGNAKSEG